MGSYMEKMEVGDDAEYSDDTTHTSLGNLNITPSDDGSLGNCDVCYMRVW